MYLYLGNALNWIWFSFRYFLGTFHTKWIETICWWLSENVDFIPQYMWSLKSVAHFTSPFLPPLPLPITAMYTFPPRAECFLQSMWGQRYVYVETGPTGKPLTRKAQSLQCQDDRRRWHSLCASLYHIMACVVHQSWVKVLAIWLLVFMNSEPAT